jgi:hypothetical protein
VVSTPDEDQIQLEPPASPLAADVGAEADPITADTSKEGDGDQLPDQPDSLLTGIGETTIVDVNTKVVSLLPPGVALATTLVAELPPYPPSGTELVCGE